MGEYEAFWACARAMGPYQGTFPGGLLSRIDSKFGIEHREVLYPFGGATPQKPNWTINDINEELDVDTHHNATDLPDDWDKEFDVVVSDPPYNEEYAEELYDVEYPGPKSHFVEAERVLRPGGWLFVLDWLVYENYRPENLARHQPIAVTCGPNTRIRVLNVFKKRGRLGDGSMEADW